MTELITGFLVGLTSMVLTFSDWTIANADMIGMATAAMGGVSAVLEPVKRFMQLSDTVLADHFKILGRIWVIKYFARRMSTVDLLHYTFAVIVAGIHYLQGSHSQNPIIVLGQAFIILGGNRFIYPTLVKPVAGVFSDAKALGEVKKAQKQAEQIVNTFQG
jgi:hypothetical protein